ncbi:MAG: hypothetical protein U1D67_04755 [Dehalococcoidia bacterium]|nr:hypothetical protein [Dehalococcoidia bacterium]
MPELDTDYGIDLLGKVTKGYALRNLMQENQMNEARMADLPGVLAHEKTIQGQTETLGSQQIARGKREAELEPLLKLQHTYELTTKVMGDMTEANYDQKRDFLMNVVPPGVAQVKIPTKTEAMAEAAGRKLTLDELLKEKYMTIAQQLELTTKQTNKLVAEKELATAGKEKAKQIRSVDVGDKVEIYEDGVLVKTVKKGKTPKDE